MFSHPIIFGRAFAVKTAFDAKLLKTCKSPGTVRPNCRAYIPERVSFIAFGDSKSLHKRVKCVMRARKHSVPTRLQRLSENRSDFYDAV